MTFPTSFGGQVGLIWARAERASWLRGTRYAMALANRGGHLPLDLEYAANLERARKMTRLPHVTSYAAVAKRAAKGAVANA